MPKFYPNGGGAKSMTTSLDELHAKEMEALLAKQAYDLHALQEKHRNQKSSAAKASLPKQPTKRRARSAKN